MMGTSCTSFPMHVVFTKQSSSVCLYFKSFLITRYHNVSLTLTNVARTWAQTRVSAGIAFKTCQILPMVQAWKIAVRVTKKMIFMSTKLDTSWLLQKQKYLPVIITCRDVSRHSYVPYRMDSWGYAWLLMLTDTGTDSSDSLLHTLTASCASPLLRASLREWASSSAADRKQMICYIIPWGENARL